MFCAIVASLEPASDASRICARFSRRNAPFPAWTKLRSWSRSSFVSVMRYRTFMMVSFRTIDHVTAPMSIDSSPPRFTETQGQYLAFAVCVSAEEIPQLRPQSIETSVPRY